MKKMKKVMKKLAELMARQVEQQDSIIVELKRHNELMAKSLALNQAALKLDRPALPEAAPKPAPKPKALPAPAPKADEKPAARPRPRKVEPEARKPADRKPADKKP